MKLKFVLAIPLFCFYITTQAQIQIGKGSVWVGGSVGITNAKNDNVTFPDSKVGLITVNPGIGIAIKDNTVAGIDIKYSHSKVETDGTSGTSISKNSYGLGIFIRQYVQVINRLYIFGQGRAGYGNTKMTDQSSTTKTTVKSWNTGLTFSPGVSFVVNNKLHVEAGFNNLFYAQYSEIKGERNYKSNSFSTGISLENSSSFFLGFRLLINNKG